MKFKYKVMCVNEPGFNLNFTWHFVLPTKSYKFLYLFLVWCHIKYKQLAKALKERHRIFRFQAVTFTLKMKKNSNKVLQADFR